MKLTAEILENNGFKQYGNWFLNDGLSINLIARIMRHTKVKFFDFSTKENNVPIEDIFEFKKNIEMFT